MRFFSFIPLIWYFLPYEAQLSEPGMFSIPASKYD